MEKRVQEVKNQVKSLIRSHKNGIVTLNQLKSDLKKLANIDLESFVRYTFGQHCSSLDVLENWSEFKVTYRNAQAYIEVVQADHIYMMNQKAKLANDERSSEEKGFSMIKPPEKFKFFDSSCESLISNVNHSEGKTFKNQKERQDDINKMRDILMQGYPTNAKTATLSQLSIESNLSGVATNLRKDVIDSSSDLLNSDCSNNDASNTKHFMAPAKRSSSKLRVFSLSKSEKKKQVELFLQPPVRENISHASDSDKDEENLKKLKKILGALVYSETNVDIRKSLHTFALLLASDGISFDYFQKNLQEMGISPLKLEELLLFRDQLPVLQNEIKSSAKANNVSVLQYALENEEIFLARQENNFDGLPESKIDINCNVTYSLLKNSTNSDISQENFNVYESSVEEEGEENPIECQKTPVLSHNESMLSVNDENKENAQEVNNVQKSNNNRFEEEIDDQWQNVQSMLTNIGNMVLNAKHEIAALKHRNYEITSPTAWIHQKELHAIAQIKQIAEVKIAEFKSKAEQIINETIYEMRETQAIYEASFQKMKFPNKIHSNEMEDFSNENDICWNCGRKASETCSGCSIARYCGSFCQHKDWESHRRNCGLHNSYSV